MAKRLFALLLCTGLVISLVGCEKSSTVTSSEDTSSYTYVTNANGEKLKVIGDYNVVGKPIKYRLVADPKINQNHSFDSFIAKSYSEYLNKGNDIGKFEIEPWYTEDYFKDSALVGCTFYSVGTYDSKQIIDLITVDNDTLYIYISRISTIGENIIDDPNQPVFIEVNASDVVNVTTVDQEHRLLERPKDSE